MEKKKTIDELTVQIEQLTNQIRKIQNECKHPPESLKKWKSPTNGAAQTEFACEVCGKRWQE
jgi:chaperonin cofactor prefoldin